MNIIWINNNLILENSTTQSQEGNKQGMLDILLHNLDQLDVYPNLVAK